MKKIKIKSMALTNFKGIRSMRVDFGQNLTKITGRNGSGKTTIFDAFTWVLFGKDSHDRKTFDIKTIGADGKPIARLPHEVTLLLDVDGEEIKLCRRYKEKWVRRRGATGEEFTGHEEERLYNDVPMPLKDWSEKISGLCSEQVFKFITSPSYFVAQKPDVQRAMLVRMAGGITDSDVAAGNADFTQLLASLTGKTLEEYKREIAAKKRNVKAEINGIPERIDERKRDTPEPLDYAALSTELTMKQKQVEHIDEQLQDKAKAVSELAERRIAITSELASLKESKGIAEIKADGKVFQNYHNRHFEQTRLKMQVGELKMQASNIASKAKNAEKEIKNLAEQRERLIAQWHEINDRKLVFDDKDFICPTCKRPLEVDDIESRQAELLAEFNGRKAKGLERNVSEGQGVKKQIDDLQTALDEYGKEQAEIHGKIKEIEAQPLYSEDIVKPDKSLVSSELAADEEYQSTLKAIACKEDELKLLDQSSTDDSNTGLKDDKKALLGEIDEIKAKLATKEIIERNNARIEELKKQMRTLNDELAGYERTDFTIQSFQKAKINAVEARINGMFKFVKFKMFDTQINGGEVETCEATVDGVPYSSLNSAKQINCGLDIINAICQFEGISAPIFIDNAEGVLQPLDTESQQVRLYVADADLTIN